MVPNFDTICVELHMKIYSFACMDDGRTGCALSAVSKLVRHLSAEYRYQSVAVAGPIPLSAFLRELNRQPPQLRRVRHLFICDHPSKRHLSLDDDDVMSADMFLELESGRRTENVGQIITDILEIVSPTLHSLALVSFNSHVDGDTQNPIPLLDHSFTALVELTVRGPHTLPISTTFAPQLQLLHLSGDALPRQFGRTVALNHPSLTHVRISRLLDIRPHIPNILELTLSMGLRRRFRADLNIPIMQGGNSRFLLVEPGARVIRRRGYNRRTTIARPFYDELVKAFELLKPHSRGFFLLRDHPEHAKGVETKYAREQWLSRLEGGAGCWAALQRSGEPVNCLQMCTEGNDIHLD